MKVKLFTHTDLDGVGCAILAKMAFGDDVDIEYCNYDNVNDVIGAFAETCKEDNIFTGDDLILITDISVNDEVAETLEDIAYVHNVVRLFDHHKTAEHLNKYSWCRVAVDIAGLKTCGTELFHDWLVSRKYLKEDVKHYAFVETVRLYDTWEWKKMTPGDSKRVKEFNDLLYILGRDEFIDRCIRRKRVKGDTAIVEFSKAERELLDRRQDEINAYIDKKAKELQVRYVNEFTEENPRKYGIVFADRFVSELGNKLCETFDGLDYVAIVDPGSCKVSLRSIKEDVDVSVIAKEHGGGGHKAAAGYHFDRNMQSIMIDAAMELIIFEVEIEEEGCETTEEITENLKKSFFDIFRRKKGDK